LKLGEVKKKTDVRVRPWLRRWSVIVITAAKNFGGLAAP